jgi:hypothetical protein
MRAEASLRQFFLSESHAHRVVTLNRHREIVTRSPAAAALHIRQVRQASAFGSFMLNAARQANGKPCVELGSIITVREWNLIVASAVTEEIETIRRGEPPMLAVRPSLSLAVSLGPGEAQPGDAFIPVAQSTPTQPARQLGSPHPHFLRRV